MNVDILFICPLPGICPREVSLFALFPAKLIERSVIEPNRTQSLDWVRLGSVIEFNLNLT